MRELISRHPWEASPLGGIATWPVSLKTVVGIMINAVQPMILWWGPDKIQIYNDAFVPSFDEGKHPQALGQKAVDGWAESWDIVGPQVDRIFHGEKPFWYEDTSVPNFRNGMVEEVFWSYTYTPVIDEANDIAGVLVLCTETTERVRERRRKLTLESLVQGVARCQTIDDLIVQLLQTASENDRDIAKLQIKQGARPRKCRGGRTHYCHQCPICIHRCRSNAVF